MTTTTTIDNEVTAIIYVIETDRQLESTRSILVFFYAILSRIPFV